MKRNYSLIDIFIIEVDHGLATVFGKVVAQRQSPASGIDEAPLSLTEKDQSEGYIRVDHTGEVCAQALYRGQMLVSRTQSVKTLLQQACNEEVDHLAWTHQRLQELGGHRSYLNGYWYLHSFFIGVLAGLAGDRWSLSFVEETERQVSRHLSGHLSTLPDQDRKSRQIVAQMREDEERHGQTAMEAGAGGLPTGVKWLMALQAKVMTTVVYHL